MGFCGWDIVVVVFCILSGSKYNVAVVLLLSKYIDIELIIRIYIYLKQKMSTVGKLYKKKHLTQ